MNVTSYQDDTTWESEAPSVLMNEADYEDDLAAEEEQVEDSYVMYEDALNAMMSSPEDSEDETCWANFQDAKKMFYKDARKALDRNRVNRGFYPNTTGTGKGKGSLSTSRSAGNGETFDGHCIRCGKYGHKAKFCKQMVTKAFDQVWGLCLVFWTLSILAWEKWKQPNGRKDRSDFWHARNDSSSRCNQGAAHFCNPQRAGSRLCNFGQWCKRVNRGSLYVAGRV